MLRKCKDCGIEKPLEQFHFANRTLNRRVAHCDVCAAIRQKHWKTNHSEQSKVHCRRKNIKAKLAAIAGYGGKCECCGESRYEFLTIEHRFGGGRQHRKELGGSANLYRFLFKNNFPPQYGLLCFNCNCAKGFFGYCPHNALQDVLIKELIDEFIRF